MTTERKPAAGPAELRTRAAPEAAETTLKDLDPWLATLRGLFRAAGDLEPEAAGA